MKFITFSLQLILLSQERVSFVSGSSLSDSSLKYKAYLENRSRARKAELESTKAAKEEALRRESLRAEEALEEARRQLEDDRRRRQIETEEILQAKKLEVENALALNRAKMESEIQKRGERLERARYKEESYDGALRSAAEFLQELNSQKERILGQPHNVDTAEAADEKEKPTESDSSWSFGTKLGIGATVAAVLGIAAMVWVRSRR
jgi:hypothetical protein